MAFKSLLLSKDAELVQTLTRLLKDLDIAVESCSEPFAAAKRLMDQHFDAILVDCEEEQGAGWVLQSARMATASKKSVTIAIIGPQSANRGGPRAGENFTIQKPIVLKQVESTLRAARGLMGDVPSGPPVAPAASSPPAAGTMPAVKPVSSAANVPTAAHIATGRPPAELFDELSAALDRLGPKAPASANPVAMTSAASGAAAAAAPAWEKPAPMPPEPAPRTEPPAEPVLRPPPPSWQGLAVPPSPPPKPPSPPPKMEVATVLPLAATSAEMKPVARPAEEQIRSNQTLDDVRRRMSATPPPAWRTEAPARHEVSVPHFASLAAAGEEPERKSPFKAIAVGMVLLSLALFGYSWYRGRNAARTPAEQAQAPAPAIAAQPQPAAQAERSAPAPPAIAPASSQSDDSSAAAADSSPETESAAATQPSRPSKAARPAKAASQSIAPDTTADLGLPPAPLVVDGGQRQRAASPRAEAQLAPPSLAAVADNAKPSLAGVVNAAPVAVPKLAAVPPQRVRVSQGVTQGLLIQQVKPQYPPMAQQTRVQGEVVLEAVIGKDGTVRDLRAISGPSMLVAAAIQAVRQWRYKPYLLNGQPVEVETQIKLEFRL